MKEFIDMLGWDRELVLLILLIPSLLMNLIVIMKNTR